MENLYFVERYANDLLEEARAAARRDALAAPPARERSPHPATVIATLRRAYVRWSSALSRGSKPTTARA